MNYIGWLAPDGTHFECNRYGHDNLTSILLKDYYRISSDQLSVIGREDTLYNRGWCRIGFQSMLSYGYSIQAKWKYLTEEQKSFIRAMYFDVGEKMSEHTIANLIDYDIIASCKEKKLRKKI